MLINLYCLLSTVKDVTSGKVDIDLSIMGMIKIKKQLDLCSVLGSDVMGHKDCPLQAGDLNLDATGKRLYNNQCHHHDQNGSFWLPLCF